MEILMENLIDSKVVNKSLGTFLAVILLRCDRVFGTYPCKLDFY